MDLIKVVNEAFATKKEFPAFKSGDRKSTRLNSSHWNKSRMPSSA